MQVCPFAFLLIVAAFSSGSLPDDEDEASAVTQPGPRADMVIASIEELSKKELGEFTEEVSVLLSVDGREQRIPVKVIRHDCLVKTILSGDETQDPFTRTMFRYRVVAQQDRNRLNWSCWVAGSPVRFHIHNDAPGKTYASYVDAYTVHLFEITESNVSDEMLRDYLSNKPEAHGQILNVGQLVGLEPFSGGVDALHSTLKVKQVYKEGDHLRVGISGRDRKNQERHYLFERKNDKWALVEGED